MFSLSLLFSLARATPADSQTDADGPDDDSAVDFVTLRKCRLCPISQLQDAAAWRRNDAKIE